MKQLVSRQYKTVNQKKMRSNNDYAARPNDANFILISSVLCRTEGDSDPGIFVNVLTSCHMSLFLLCTIDLGDDRIRTLNSLQFFSLFIILCLMGLSKWYLKYSINTCSL